MSRLEQRIRQKLGLIGDPMPPLPDRWPVIAAHYERCMARGMSLNQAAGLALSNLSGSNLHDVIRK